MVSDAFLDSVTEKMPLIWKFGNKLNLAKK